MLAQHPRRSNQTVFNERSLGNVRDVAAPHVQAFSYAVTEGFMSLHLPNVEFKLPGAAEAEHRLKLTFDPATLHLGVPTVEEGKLPLYPRECRGKFWPVRRYPSRLTLNLVDRARDGLRGGIERRLAVQFGWLCV
jgi:hypothetical protein